MNVLSASRLHRASKCPASMALPWVESTSPDSERGTLVHRFLEVCALRGREAALAEMPGSVRDLCESIDLTQMPIGRGFEPEVKFAFDLATGKARRLASQGARDYSAASETEVVGTADVVGVFDGEVYVADYKVGFGHDAYTPAVERNAQLKFLVLAACRESGVESARAQILHIRDSGDVWVEQARWDVFDLVAFEEELRATVARVKATQARAAAGEPVNVTSGAWCRYCPAFAACPANRDLVVTLATAPESLAARAKAELTPTTAANAFHMVRKARAVLKEIDAALYAYAEEVGGIDLGDGTVFGVRESKREEVDGRVAFEVLAQKYGAEVAKAACGMESSKAAVRRALQQVKRSLSEMGEDVTVAALEREAMQAIRANGGVLAKESKRVKVYRADAPEVEVDE